jgi:ABC-type transport system involved in multi-copper enzyme maturation permease subunit
MKALLAGELRRALARRLVRVAFALAAVGIVVAGVIVFLKTHHLSEATYQARVEAAQTQANVKGIPLCPPGQQGEAFTRGPNGEIQPVCIPKDAIRVHDPRLHLTSVKGVLEGVTAPFVILASLIGASIIGAEWPSRTITTILTWEPRRVRVLSAKVLAAIVVGMALTLTGLVLLVLALLPSALVHGTTAGATAEWWRSVAGVGLRAMAMAAIGTTIGFSIASVGRNTAAAMGVLFAYILVIENVVGNLLAGWRRWLILGNAIVFVGGKSGDATGVRGRSVAVAGLYLAAVAVVMFAVAAALFQRRDVA